MDRLLKLLEQDGRLSLEQLAVMLDTDQETVAARMDELAQSGVIMGYQAIINWEKTDHDLVTSIIELKVTPKRDHGFDEIAEAIAQLPEVDSVFLMSGGYDLAITVHGKTFKDVALFVAKRLSTMDSVLSTGTHFVLKKYKDRGIIFDNSIRDGRELANL